MEWCFSWQEVSLCASVTQQRPLLDPRQYFIPTSVRRFGVVVELTRQLFLMGKKTNKQTKKTANLRSILWVTSFCACLAEHFANQLSPSNTVISLVCTSFPGMKAKEPNGTCLEHNWGEIPNIHSAELVREWHHQTHHDIIRQLVWKGLKSLVQGFVVIGHLPPAHFKVVQHPHKSNFKTFPFKPLLAFENTVQFGIPNQTIGCSRGSSRLKKMKTWCNTGGRLHFTSHFGTK